MNIFEEFDEYVAPEMAKCFSKKEILEIKERIGFSYLSKRTELLRKHDLKVSCKERKQKAKMEKIFYETVQNHDLTFEASIAFLEKEYIERLKK